MACEWPLCLLCTGCALSPFHHGSSHRVPRCGCWSRPWLSVTLYVPNSVYSSVLVEISSTRRGANKPAGEIDLAYLRAELEGRRIHHMVGLPELSAANCPPVSAPLSSIQCSTPSEAGGWTLLSDDWNFVVDAQDDHSLGASLSTQARQPIRANYQG